MHVRMSDWHVIGNVSLSNTAVCASLASVITKTVLFPMDTIKCRLMSTGALHFRSIFNGLLPKIALYAPYQAVYMTTYTAAREELSQAGPLGFALAGVTAELAGAFIRVPMEAIKQQMQAGFIRSNRELVKLVLENPFRFHKYRNFIAQTLVHDLPCGALHWVVYEWVRRDQQRSSWLAGAIAGTSAAILTNPLDVVKTRMITRPLEHPTVASTVKSLLSQKGPRIFLTGVVPRICHLAPNSAIYMFVFDSLYRRNSCYWEIHFVFDGV